MIKSDKSKDLLEKDLYKFCKICGIQFHENQEYVACITSLGICDDLVSIFTN